MKTLPETQRFATNIVTPFGTWLYESTRNGPKRPLPPDLQFPRGKAAPPFAKVKHFIGVVIRDPDKLRCVLCERSGVPLYSDNVTLRALGLTRLAHAAAPVRCSPCRQLLKAGWKVKDYP